MSSIGFKAKELHLFKSTYRRREHGDIGGSYIIVQKLQNQIEIENFIIGIYNNYKTTVL